MQLLSGSYREVVCCRQVRDLTLAETTYAPHLRQSKHSHESAYFCFLLNGACSETNHTGGLDCGPETLMFRPPGEAHSVRFHQQGGRCLIIGLSPEYVARIGGERLLSKEPHTIRTTMASWFARQIYRELHAMDEISPLAIEGFALSMLAETLRQPVHPGRKPPRWLAQAREIIQAEFTNQLSLETIAKRVGVHPMHLPRAFRRHYGCTVGELVRQLRLAFACHQLSSSNLPVIEIALDAGFCDHSHFARSLKKLTGLSPTEYRAAKLRQTRATSVGSRPSALLTASLN